MYTPFCVALNHVPSPLNAVGKGPGEAEPSAKKAKMEALGPQAFLQSGMASSYATQVPGMAQTVPSFTPPSFQQPEKVTSAPVAPLFPSAATPTAKVGMCNNIYVHM